MRLKINCFISPSETNSQQLRESNNSPTKKPIQLKGESGMKTQISKKHTSISCHTKSAKSNKKSTSHFSSNSKQSDAKKIDNSNLKHNKSYEDGFETNNLLLTELSPRKPNDSFNKKTFYVQPRNINNYKGMGSSGKNQIDKSMNQKNFGNKRNKSYENVSQHHRSNINSQSYPKKIKEGLKTLDSVGLERNYETNVKREEMPSGANDNKKGIFRITLEKGKNKTEEIITQSEREDKDQREDMSFVLSTNQFEEENDSSNFSQLKENFEILYNKEYIKTIPKEMIRLELQVLIENICELQDAYHKEIMIELANYSKYKELFANYSERYLLINKKQLKLKEEIERSHVMNIFHTFINNHKLKHSRELLSINRKEIGLWNKIPLQPHQLKNKNMISVIAKGVIMKNKHLISDYHNQLYDRIMTKQLKSKVVSDNSDTNKTPSGIYYRKGSNLNGNNSKMNQGGNFQTAKNPQKIHSLLGSH